MGISSMTGFARSNGQSQGYRWCWSVKSVNGRGLDVRCRVPAEVDGLDVEARRRIAARFARGSISSSLELWRDEQQDKLRINEPALDQLLDALARLGPRPGIGGASLDGLLGIKGIIQVEEIQVAAEDLHDGLLAGLESCLTGLWEARRAEGERLVPILRDQLQSVSVLTGRAGQAESAQLTAIQTRLGRQIAELMQDQQTIPEDRIAQEVALLSVKADVREEIDRLNAHAASAGQLLESDKPVGRKLDFLAQEMNREANTLSAKAADMEMKNIGLDLKAVIDQFREQCQNIE